MRKNVKPIFLFSMPRSGSTWLQTKLSFNPNIATVSEPWILLHLFQLNSDIDSYSSISNYQLKLAIKQVDENLKIRGSCLNEINKNYYLRICKSLSSNKEKYFLDKTPRYIYILDKIYETFSDSKFIILWRHPLSILRSTYYSFWSKKTGLLHSRSDLYEGFLNLIEFSKNRPNIVTLNYENLLNSDSNDWLVLEDYLKLKLTRDKISKENLVKGIMGDSSMYKVNYTNNLEDDISQLNSIFLKKEAYSLTKHIGEENFKHIGYDYNQTIKLIDKIPFSLNNLFKDGKGYLGEVIARKISYHSKFKRSNKNRYLS